MTPHTLPPPGEERHAVSLARCGWMHQAVLPLRGDTLANSYDLTKATLSQPPCHRCCGNGDSHSGPYHRHASLSPTPPVAVASPHLSAAHRMSYVCRLSPSPPFSSPCQQAAVMSLSHPHLHPRLRQDADSHGLQMPSHLTGRSPIARPSVPPTCRHDNPSIALRPIPLPPAPPFTVMGARSRPPCRVVAG